MCALKVSPLARSLLEYLRQLPELSPYSVAHARLLRILVDQFEQARCTGSYMLVSDDPVLLQLQAMLQSDTADDRLFQCLRVQYIN